MKKIAAIGFALLMIFAVFVPAVAALNDPTKVGYQSVVNPNPKGDGGALPTVGYLYVDLACRSPQIGGEFTATPVIVSAPFTNAARVDKGFVDQFVKVVGAPVTYQFLPQGQFDTQAEPGTYLLQMKDGNNGQPEFALVAIKAGFKETVVFLGHGISMQEPETEVALPEIKVLTATYGMTKLVVVPCVPAVTHTETVTDVAAYDETVVDQASYDEQIPAVTHVVHHNAVTHTITVVDVPAQPATEATGTPCSQNAQGHVHARQATGSQHDFVYNGHTYQITGNSHDSTFTVTPGHAAIPAVTHTETVVDTPAFDETVVDVPAQTVHHDAVTHVVHHAAQTHTITVVDTPAVPGSVHLEGSFKNVKAQVQAAVDANERTFKFDNAQNPGGLFDGENNLLAAINDPAPGQVKKFVITYKVNGHIKVAAGDEYEEFTLG